MSWSSEASNCVFGGRLATRIKEPFQQAFVALRLFQAGSRILGAGKLAICGELTYHSIEGPVRYVVRTSALVYFCSIESISAASSLFLQHRA